MREISLPDGRTLSLTGQESPEQLSALKNKLRTTYGGQEQAQSTGFDVGRFAANIPRKAGQAVRTVAAGFSSLPDTALLIPKTAAALGEGITEAAGFEGSKFEKALEKIRTTPTMRESTLGIIDKATGDQLKPQGLAENIIMGAGELVFPAGAVSKAAPNLLTATRSVINPLGAIEAKAKQIFPASDVLTKQGKVTSKAVKKAAGKAFDKAEKIGGETEPEVANVFLEKMIASAEPENKRVGNVFKNEPIRKLMTGIFDEYADKPMTLDDIKSLDESLGKEASRYFTKIDGAAPEYAPIKAMQAALRDAVEEAIDNPALLKGTSEGFKTHREAIKLYASAKRIEEVEDIVNKAMGQQQPARALRRGFDRLRNQKGFNRYSPEAQEIINQLADETITDDLAKTLTSRLGAIIGFGSGHPVLSAILTGVSTLARRGEAAKELTKVNKLKQVTIKDTNLLQDLGPKSLSDLQRGGIGALSNLTSRTQ